MTCDITEIQDLPFNTLASEYSDHYKSVYGFRPHGAVTRQEILAFFAAFDEIAEREAEYERQFLANHGVGSWDEFHDLQQAKYDADSVARTEAREAAEAHRQAYLTRGHTLPVVEAWEYGVIA